MFDPRLADRSLGQTSEQNKQLKYQRENDRQSSRGEESRVKLPLHDTALTFIRVKFSLDISILKGGVREASAGTKGSRPAEVCRIRHPFNLHVSPTPVAKRAPSQINIDQTSPRRNVLIYIDNNDYKSANHDTLEKVERYPKRMNWQERTYILRRNSHKLNIKS